MAEARHTLSIPARLMLALVLALAFDWLVTIEWTWPDCNGGDRWLAAYGLPLPYTSWGGVSSLEYTWVPGIFAVNIAVLTAVFFAALRWLPRFRHSGKVYAVLTIVAVLTALFNLLMLSVTIVSSRDSLAQTSVGQSMWDLRPVAIQFKGYRRYECTRSPYWFGDRRPDSGFPARPEPATPFP